MSCLGKRDGPNSAVVHIIETPAIARAVKQKAAVFRDFLKMRINGIEPSPVVDGDGGDEDIEPGDGEALSPDPPGEGDGAVMHLVVMKAIDHSELLQGLASRSRDFR